MDVEKFLIKQGWKKGQGLRPGAIKTALLVKHRKDNKGLGFNPQASEGWWERMFDGHLKSLDVGGSGTVEFKFDEEKRRRETSPLYASFHSGGMLEGTVETIQKQKKSKESKTEGLSKSEAKSKPPIEPVSKMQPRCKTKSKSEKKSSKSGKASKVNKPSKKRRGSHSESKSSGKKAKNDNRAS